MNIFTRQITFKNIEVENQKWALMGGGEITVANPGDQLKNQVARGNMQSPRGDH